MLVSWSIICWLGWMRRISGKDSLSEEGRFLTMGTTKCAGFEDRMWTMIERWDSQSRCQDAYLRRRFECSGIHQTGVSPCNRLSISSALEISWARPPKEKHLRNFASHKTVKTGRQFSQRWRHKRTSLIASPRRRRAPLEVRSLPYPITHHHASSSNPIAQGPTQKPLRYTGLENCRNRPRARRTYVHIPLSRNCRNNRLLTCAPADQRKTPPRASRRPASR